VGQLPPKSLPAQSASHAASSSARPFLFAETLRASLKPHLEEARDRSIEVLMEFGADLPTGMQGDGEELGRTVAAAFRAAIDGAKSDEVIVAARVAGARDDERTIEVDVRAVGVALSEPITRTMRAIDAAGSVPAIAPALRGARILIVAEREGLRAILRDELARAGLRTSLSQDFDFAFQQLTTAAEEGDRFAVVVVALDGVGEVGHDRARKLVQRMRLSKTVAKTGLVLLSPGSRRDPAAVGFPQNGIVRLVRPVTHTELVQAINGLFPNGAPNPT
jgi:hypothetical protein